MRKGLIFSLFVLGLSSVISQVVVLRELTITFYGNEFFIGVVLASWLAWVAIGSGILGKIFNRLKRSVALLMSLHFLLGVFFFLEIFLIRFLKSLIGFPGEIPNLIFAILNAFLIPAPLCLILGLWWTIATKIFCQVDPHTTTRTIPTPKFGVGEIDEVKSSFGVGVNRAYFIEILGFILGGILFSFLLVQLHEFLIAGILLIVNLAAIIFLSCRKARTFAGSFIRIALPVSFLIFLLFVFSPHLAELNKITQNFRFKNQTLVESINSPYGNIAVTKMGGQYNFYESGLLLGSEEEIEFSEYLVHFSLLQHPSPEKILLIGGGFNGALNELLKHPVEKIYYLELDPELIKISQKYVSQELRQALANPKVKIINIDGCYFLKKTQEKFDAILLSLPDPSTALINRFYTEEFFAAAKEKLKENGIFVTYLTFSPSTPGKNLENLNAAIFKTLKKVFNEVIILPEETNFFLAHQNSASQNLGGQASLHETLTYNPEILIQRFKERNIETKFLTTGHITYRFSTDRIQKTLNVFEKNQEAKKNKDAKPVAYFYQTLFWLDRFYPKFSNFFKNLARSFWLIFAGVLLILTLILLKKRKGARKNFPIFSVAVAGFSLMALEIIIIFAYQITIGYLYYRLALLISALMAGMAAGVWYGNRTRSFTPFRMTILFHLLLIIFCAVLPLVLGSATEIVFLLLAIIAGFLGAAIFPLANHIYLSQQPEPHKKTGTVYSADLTGSCLGALLPGLILIPVFGVFQSLIFIALANLWIILVLILLWQRLSD